MAKAIYTRKPKRGYPEGVYFDDGEHGLEVEYMTCEGASGKPVEPQFWFTILGNHAYLSQENAKQLVEWLQDYMLKAKESWE